MRLRARHRPGEDHRVGHRGAGQDARARPLRLDRAVRAGRERGLKGRPERPGLDRPRQAPGRVGIRVSSEYEVQVTEEFEVTVSEDPTPTPTRSEHSSPDRTQARELFERLSKLPAGDPERGKIRSPLVELPLPLVEYLARRFRNRGEWLDDLTQVATIGLIKSINRFDLERGGEVSTYAPPPPAPPPPPVRGTRPRPPSGSRSAASTRRSKAWSPGSRSSRCSSSCRR